MTKIYPDSNKTLVQFHSSAEQKVYHALTSLEEQWVAYYSIFIQELSDIPSPSSSKAKKPPISTIKNQPISTTKKPPISSQANNYRKGEGEVDFIVYHPKFGLILIEVKGGRIEYNSNSGEYFSIDRYQRKHAIKNPFQQIAVSKNRLVRQLRSQNIKVPVSAAVILPDVELKDMPFNSGRSDELVIDRFRMQELHKYLSKVAKSTHEDKYLKFNDVSEVIHQMIWGKGFSTKTYLRQYIDQNESKLDDLESLHENFLAPIIASNKLGVEGQAGTGKTLLANEAADYFAKQGKRVLYLTANEVLAEQNQKSSHENIIHFSYEQLASKFGIQLLQKPDFFEGSEEDWRQIEAPQRWIDCVKSDYDRYDVIICDEAQDVQPFWWEPIQLSLKASQEGEEPRFYVFFDRGQGIFGSGATDNSFVPEDILPVPAPYLPLIHNYRLTRELSDFSQHFRSNQQVFESHSSRIGYLPKLVLYKDKADAIVKMEALVKDLLVGQHVLPEEITLLSARKPFGEKSIIEGHKELCKHSLRSYKDLSAEDKKKTPKPYLGVSTIQSFKGLETKIGIVLNISEYNLDLTHPIFKSLFYVASTRARHMLYIMVQEGDAKATLLAEYLDKTSKGGEIILSDDQPLAQYHGKVKFYNAERYGVIELDGDMQTSRKVIFLPVDLEKNLKGKITVGSTVEFTLEQESQQQVAVDLKLVAT